MTDTFVQTLRHRAVLLWLALFLAFLPLLGIVPYWFSIDSDVASAAAAQGYHNGAAYYLMLLLSIFGLTAFAFLRRLGYFNKEQQDPAAISDSFEASAKIGNVRLILEASFIAVFTILVYFPLFLAKYGPYIEDNAFLTVLHRMHGGQRPYVDFEFLYGPLMIYAPHLWNKLFGYSAVSYYSFLALLEAIQFSALFVIFRRYFSKLWVVAGVFLLLTFLTFNPILGLNYTGLRRLLPVLIILMVATNPHSRPVVATASVLLGLLLAYSHDFGIACLAAVIAIYGLMFIRSRGAANAIAPLFIVATSLLVWFLVAFSLLGDGFTSYLDASRSTIERFNAGEQGFPFYWTVNSLAVFGLLCLALSLVGRGLGKRVADQVGPGDYLLFGALVYAIIGLKSGLNRADMWHLVSPLLPLIVAFLLPLPKILFAPPHWFSRLAVGLVLIISVTYVAALGPSGSLYARGWLLGLKDTIFPASSSRIERLETRAPSIEGERSHPDPDVLRLAAYLTDPARAQRSVVLYGRLWSLDKRIGVYKTIYPTDDFLLSDEMGLRIREFMQQNPNTIVVMRQPDYCSVFGPEEGTGAQQPERFYPETPTKKVLSLLSTVHFNAVEIEYQQKLQRWERTVGYYVRSHYHKVAEFGDLVVLEQKSLTHQKKQLDG